MIVVSGCGYIVEKAFAARNKLFSPEFLETLGVITLRNSSSHYNAAGLPSVKRITVGDDNLLPC